VNDAQENPGHRFERMVVPHLDAAYNLARWLTRDAHDAEDVVQESYLRAFRAFGSFHGDDARCWLLTIVRNTCFSWLSKNRIRTRELFPDVDMPEVASDTFDPQAPLIREADQALLREALEELPAEFREVIVLRELEELSYKQIAEITTVPIGTVMSRLARARRRLEDSVLSRTSKEEV